MLLQRVKDAYGDRLRIEWHSFPLEQVNSVHGPSWKLWEQPDEYRSRGLWALRAGEAAKLQGDDGFQRFHMALLRARHVDKKDIADRSVLLEAAREAGLDLERFQRDLADRSLLAKIAGDYDRGVQQHGIWGTPTLVFGGGASAYLRMKPAPPPEESVKTFEDLYDVIAGRPYVLEIKRPR